jgi:hypothetical protein
MGPERRRIAHVLLDEVRPLNGRAATVDVVRSPVFDARQRAADEGDSAG